MDLISWSLNAIGTIFPGSREPTCPVRTFAACYTMDGWEKWCIVCLATLSLEDFEDVYLFGALNTGFLLMGLCGALGYQRLLKVVSEESPQADRWIVTAIGIFFATFFGSIKATKE